MHARLVLRSAFNRLCHVFVGLGLALKDYVSGIFNKAMLYVLIKTLLCFVLKVFVKHE